MNDIFATIDVDVKSQHTSFKNQVHILLSLLNGLKLLFSGFTFFLICFVYLSKRQRYLDRRNIDRYHRDYYIVNCSYFFVVFTFSIAISLFTYYYPLITFVYIVFKSR